MKVKVKYTVKGSKEDFERLYAMARGQDSGLALQAPASLTKKGLKAAAAFYFKIHGMAIDPFIKHNKIDDEEKELVTFLEKNEKKPQTAKPLDDEKAKKAKKKLKK